MLMAHAVRHRGPDGAGAHAESNWALGHVRLAILDLTKAAAQPMRTRDGLHTIVYNGEIYNFQEVRAELVKRGHEFCSRSDTEVVLMAYREWGADCVNHFNGMFAFCIVDAVRNCLFFARDRYGIKPLYYGFFGNSLLFASEAKAFLRHPAFRPALDCQALKEYLTFQNILSDRTFFEGVCLFPAGSCGTLPLNDAGVRELRITRYWDYAFEEADLHRSEADAEAELLHLFEQAVTRQLVSDVELGAYLSGGVDSGSISAVAAGRLPCIKSFTCGFDLRSASGLEMSFDEREKAEYLSYLFKTEHYEIVLKSGDLERVMPTLAWHMEEPRLGQSYPNFYASKLASRFVRVVLAGGGGDELFAGYPWRYYRALHCRSFDDYVDQYYAFWQRLIPADVQRTLLQPVAAQTGHVCTRDIFRHVFAANTTKPETPEACVNRSLYFEAKTFLHGLLLVEDKLSMAHGLETRLPFLDNDLVDFAMRLPVRLKLKNLSQNITLNENLTAKSQHYYARYADGKYLLRKAMTHFVPESVATAAKQGFSGPDASWFRGDSLDYVKKLLFTPKAQIWQYLDYATAETLTQEHMAGKQNHRLFIWSLLSIEWWLRRYLP